MSSDPFEPVAISSDKRRFRRAVLISTAFAAVLWWIKLVETVAHIDLVAYGIYPRKSSGLVGVLTAPFIHGSVAHLFSNTVPIVVLGTALLYGYPRSARVAVPALVLGAGLGVWWLGRASYHVGASGVTFGMMFFVLTAGVLRWDRRAIGLALSVFFLYGGMVWGVFPGAPGVSYESHLAGALTGVVLAFLLRNLDPAPAPRRYSWEHEPTPPPEEPDSSPPPGDGSDRRDA